MGRPLRDAINKLLNRSLNQNIPTSTLNNVLPTSSEKSQNIDYKKINIPPVIKNLFSSFYNWFFISDDTPKFKFGLLDLYSVFRAGISATIVWGLMLFVSFFGNILFAVLLGMANENVISTGNTLSILVYVILAMLFQAFRRWLGQSQSK